jgi:hypothetical protein
LTLGDLNNALADYNESVRLDPQSATARFGRGLTRLRTGAVPAGNSDIATAKAKQADIAERFGRQRYAA